MTPDTPAIRAITATGVAHRIVEYGKVPGLEEAARRLGVDPHCVMKSLVVRTADDEYVMVIVPGDRVIDWPKLRELLGESRMSLAPTDEAFAVTGYHRGAITPFGSIRQLPVICDSSVTGEISIGGGVHGVSILLDASDLIEFTGSVVADVTKPA
jgi:Cys-tRNA(Pro) deacylase